MGPKQIETGMTCERTVLICHVTGAGEVAVLRGCDGFTWERCGERNVDKKITKLRYFHIRTMKHKIVELPVIENIGSHIHIKSKTFKQTVSKSELIL